MSGACQQREAFRRGQPRRDGLPKLVDPVYSWGLQ